MEPKSETNVGATLAQNQLENACFNSGLEVSCPSLEKAQAGARAFVPQMEKLRSVFAHGTADLFSELGIDQSEMESQFSEENADPEKIILDGILKPLYDYDVELKKVESLLLETPPSKELAHVDTATMDAVIEIRRELDTCRSECGKMIKLRIIAEDPFSSFRIDKAKLADSINEARDSFLKSSEESLRQTLRLLNNTRAQG